MEKKGNTLKFPSSKHWIDILRKALSEDIGSGDATTLSTVEPDMQATGIMHARERMIVSGMPLIEQIFAEYDFSVAIQHHQMDGNEIEDGDKILTLSGSAQSILTCERVALNYLQHMSGIATHTHKFWGMIRDTNVKLLDTRKTTPGFRQLEKYAVSCGGGTNHRIGLFDLIMVKDNHIQTLRSVSDNPIALAVERARSRYPDLKVEVEADHISQVKEAISAGVDIILLDNMSITQLCEAVSLCKGHCETEASGGINLDTIESIASTGVDYISVGSLTHSARNVDIGLDFEIVG